MTRLIRNQGNIALWSIILIGIVLRFLPGLQAGFPLNDGGMFLSMIRDLRASYLMLPAVTSYNLSDIPFAYPPFGFYIAALFSGWFGLSDIELLRWLPAIAGAGIVPVFYWLSLRIFRDATKSSIAVVFAAFLPGSFDWLIMGGGLTRAFGILFFLAGIGHALVLFRDGVRKSLWFAILFCALAILSHPEVGLQAAGICFLLWLLFGRNREGVKNAILAGLGTVLLTSPWWTAILLQHGFEPFASALQTGIRERLTASLFHSFFSTQGGLPILPVLTLLGLFVTLRRRRYLFFGWAFLPFFLDPRNAPAIAMYAFILLSSEGLYFLRDVLDKGKPADRKVRYILNSVFALLTAFLFWNCFTSAGDFSRVSLTEADRATMAWVRDNTSKDAQFLLLTNSGGVSPMVDAYQEWFPALAERHSQNTLQGREWTLGAQFYEYSLELMDLQACEDVACLREWGEDQDIQIDFLLLRPGYVRPTLVVSIRTDNALQVVYESGVAVIFENK